MAYKLSVNKSVQKKIKRIAIEEIDKTITELNNSDLELNETVHRIRKRCKKIRGLIRIVRPEFADYSLENSFFRDTAKNFSDLRDTQIMLATYDGLMAYFADHIERQSFAPVRRVLTLRRQRLPAREDELRRQLVLLRPALQQAGRRVADWSLTASGFAAIEEGLQKTYRRARKAMAKAYTGKPRAGRFHEWRKRVKYHRYHLRLLRPLWPPVIEAHWQQAKYLSDLLGDEHDLAVLQQLLAQHTDEFAGIEALPAFKALISQRRRQLQQQAGDAGERIFAEKPNHFSRRLQVYWESRL
jgi:CHAD domain-containing protein